MGNGLIMIPIGIIFLKQKREDSNLNLILMMDFSLCRSKISFEIFIESQLLKLMMKLLTFISHIMTPKQKELIFELISNKQESILCKFIKLLKELIEVKYRKSINILKHLFNSLILVFLQLKNFQDFVHFDELFIGIMISILEFILFGLK
jgi:hypothetical protein